MPKLARITIILFACLLAAVAVRFSAAQKNASIPFSADGSHGKPSFPHFGDSDAKNKPDADDIRGRIEASRALQGPVTEEVKLNAIKELQRQQRLYSQQLSGANPPAGIPSWISLGPTEARYETNDVTLKVSDSGRIRTILPHPTDPDTMYVLTSGGGLWKTTTFTHKNPHWDAKTDALISTSGGSAAFGRNPNTLYLGIGDPFDGVGLITGVMVKSTDGGNSWGPFINLPGAINVRDVKVDTSGPNDIILVATDVGLFRSTNSGATFSQVGGESGQAFENKNLWSLVRTSAGWLANAQEDDGAGNFSGPGSLFFSTDMGATWSPIPNAGNGYNNAGRTTLAVASAGESVVYAIAGDVTGFTQQDLFKSTNGGLNWVALNITSKTPTNPDACFQPDMNILNSQAWYNQLLLVDPQDASRSTVYLGGQYATAKTVDGGNTWALLSVWLPFHSLDPTCSNLPYVHADCHAAAFTTLGGRHAVLFGTDGGLFVSIDGGSTWSDDKNDGIVSMLFNSVVSSTKNPQDMIGGTQDDGTRARLGGSSVFNQVVGGDGEGVGWSQANNKFTLASVYGSDIFRIEGFQPNTKGNWTEAVDGIGGLDFYPFYTDIETPKAAADPTGLQFFTVTGWRVYKTSDGAGSWQVIGEAGFNGLSPKMADDGSFQQVFQLNEHGIGISPLDTNHIAVSEIFGLLAITTNGGSTWVERNLKTLVPGYGGINSSPAWANNSTLYESSGSLSPNALRLLKSTNGGATWSAASHGLPDVPINRILADPRDASGKTVYSATYIGVYRTTDGGANWSLFGAGLPQVQVTDLYMPPDGSFLRAATYGRGLWEIDPRKAR